MADKLKRSWLIIAFIAVEVVFFVLLFFPGINELYVSLTYFGMKYYEMLINEFLVLFAIFIFACIFCDKSWFSKVFIPLILAALLWLIVLLISNKDVSYRMSCIYAIYALAGITLIFMSRKYSLGVYTNLFSVIVYASIMQITACVFLDFTQETDMLFYFDNTLLMMNGGKGINLYHAIFPHTLTYPAFLAVFMRIFGYSMNVAFVINHAAVILSAGIVYLIAAKALPPGFSLGAGVLAAIAPANIIYTRQMQAELLYGLFCLAAVCAFLYATSGKRRIILGVASGVLCVISGFFRPVGLIILIALLLYLIIFDNFRGRKDILVMGGLLTVIFILGNFAINTWISKLTNYPYPKSSYGWNLFVGASESGGWNTEDAAEFSIKSMKLKDPGKVHEYFAKEGFLRYMKMGKDFIPHLEKKAKTFFSGWYPNEIVRRMSKETYFYGVDMLYAHMAVQFIHTLFVAFGTLGFLAISIVSIKSSKIRPLQTITIYCIGISSLLLIMEMAPRYTMSLQSVYAIGIAALFYVISCGVYGVSSKQRKKNTRIGINSRVL